MSIFHEKKIGDIKFSNGLFRSATFEAMADDQGYITKEYEMLYKDLFDQKIGGVITGFVYIMDNGKAMQPKQAGFDNYSKVKRYKNLCDYAKVKGVNYFVQLAHVGRQTKSYRVKDIVSSSSTKSFYFGERAKKLEKKEIEEIIEKFGEAALHAKKIGFTGIQLHCAHGYLIHQFLTKAINKRKDEYGIGKGKIATKFLGDIIDEIKKVCGDTYPILVKISGSDDLRPKFDKEELVELIKFLDEKKVFAIEISYGTMDYALNIFRGKSIPISEILEHNPIYKIENRFLKKTWRIFIYPLMKIKIIDYKPMYNLEYAVEAKKYTNIPIITVGGFRTMKEIEYAFCKKRIDFVSLSRPFLCESDFLSKLKENKEYKSKCINCNICAIMTDSGKKTKCILNKGVKNENRR